MTKNEIILYLQRVFFKVDMSKKLLYDGKVIPADKKLQGVSDNIISLINYLSEDIKNESDNNR